MIRFMCLGNALLRKRSVVHLGGGHQVLDSMGLLGFLDGGLELAWGHLGCYSVHVGRVDPVIPTF
jgi:hypothetical protein